MKSIWTGAIGFGLVNIPVKLYSASQESTLDLDMLDKHDLSHIKFQRINESTGKPVQWKDIVKGYLYKDNYVVLSDKDFEKASPEKTKLINITSFIQEDEVDSIYYETPYYLEPQKGGDKAYVLLREALEKSGKAGFGSFVLRNKEHLCLIKPYEQVLVLNKIRFQEEIRDVKEITLPKSKLKSDEIKMALSLIDQLSDKFDISRYKDTYSSELLKHIKAKSTGKPVKTPHMRVTHRKSTDLLTQLKASLKKAS
ncbi:MAG TPA: Ku protein [Cyclobacteriaceae bacterium]